jgi:hypothetical protein
MVHVERVEPASTLLFTQRARRKDSRRAAPQRRSLAAMAQKNASLVAVLGVLGALGVLRG